MCTVTLIARRYGYVLGMNRDESLARVAALPPFRHRFANRSALFPAEPNGGTWIGVNDVGITFALVNWYSVSARAAGQTVSRGEVVKSSLTADSPSRAAEGLEKLPLTCVNPFRLIGVFPAIYRIVEWRWNLRQFERHDHDWRANTWISSGFDEPGAQQTRGKAFRDALRQRSTGSADWLRRLHRSHAPERGPYSHCMHRSDASTVSYTEVAVSRQTATMRYTSRSPCCAAPMPALRLPLDW